MLVRRFFKDSFIYSLGSLLSKGIGLILLPFYTRVLSTTDYGLLDLLGIFAVLVNLTIALEISQAVARYFPGAETEFEKISYASTSLWFTVVVYSLFCLIVFWGAPFFATLVLDDSLRGDLMRVAAISMWLSGLFYLSQNQLRWQLKPLLYAVTNIVFAITAASSAVLLVFVANLGLLGILWGQVIGFSCGISISLYFTRKLYRLRFDWQKLKQMLRFSLPLVPSGISVFVALYIDRLAIKELMTIADVGIYSVAYRLASIASLLIMGVQGAVTPLVYNHYLKADTPLQLARIFRYFLWAACILFLGSFLFAEYVLTVFAPPEYAAAASLLPLLLAALVLSNMYIFAPGLSIAAKTGEIAVINMLTAAVNALLTFLLIPLLGRLGAALATLLSSSFMFAGFVLRAQTHYPIPYLWANCFKAILIVSLVGCGTFILRAFALSLLVELTVKLLLLVLSSFMLWYILVITNSTKTMTSMTEP